MSRILFDLKISTTFFKTFIDKKITNEFLKISHDRGIFLNNNYIYYEYFFFSNISNFSKKLFKINLVSLYVLKKFFNFFYNSMLLGNNFMVFDDMKLLNSPFVFLCFNEAQLLKYNFFFKRDELSLKQPYEYLSLRVLFKKANVTLLLVLNYDVFYKYIPTFSKYGAAIFSFVKPNVSVDMLDFFLFKSSSFFNLEKIFFVSKIYSIYMIAHRVKLSKLIKMYGFYYKQLPY